MSFEELYRQFAIEQLEAQILRVETRPDVPITRLEKLGKDAWEYAMEPVRTHYLCPSCSKPTHMDFEYADPLYRDPIDEGFVPDPIHCRECRSALEGKEAS
jgi:hypothetical protein